MKNILLYNYNLNIEKMTKLSDNIISFYIQYDKYYFIKLERVKADIQLIYDYLKNRPNIYHKIIKNNFDEIFTNYNGNTYILIKINGPENSEIDLKEILKSQILVDDKQLVALRRNNWGALWSEKIDYLEYQVSELGNDHPIVVNSFSYYVGLAENAVEYFNMLTNVTAPLVLCQKRISSPNIALNYYNPLTLIVDYRVRDTSEYIKSNFYNDDNIMEEIDLIIERNILSSIEYNLLFARLLYPSFYFDELTQILEHEKDEETLLKYIEKADAYEMFLKEVLIKLSRKCNMINIEWLIKKL